MDAYNQICNYMYSTVGSQDRILFMDIECYKNYFLVMFLHKTSRHVVHFYQDSQSLSINAFKKYIEWLMCNFTIVGFNIKGYDLILLDYALSDTRTLEELKTKSNSIIDARGYLQAEIPATWDNIDLMKLVKNDKDSETNYISLKMCGARLNATVIQDLPYDHNSELTVSMQESVKEYCLNDLLTTELLYDNLKDRIELRKMIGAKYKCDLRSKSDAQIAEHVFKKIIYNMIGDWLKAPEIEDTSLRYEPKIEFNFQHPDFQNIYEKFCNKEFVIDHNGNIMKIDYETEINNFKLSVGIGGLHSSEKSIVHHASDDFKIIDADVQSYYPNLILLQNLQPIAIGELFGKIYRTILNDRIFAKENGDYLTAETFKIILNGTYGKLGSSYSIFYSPQLLLQVTLTGQLALLKLIEMLVYSGIDVISANTDGVTCKIPTGGLTEYHRIVELWQNVMQMKLEFNEYRSVYSRDVNNYIIQKSDGKFKIKGCYGQRSLSTGIDHPVVNKAIIEYLSKGVPFNETLMNETDISQFCMIRKVKGGAIFRNEDIGKTVRYVYAKNGGTMFYKDSGNKVPKSNGALPVMDFNKINDIELDYDRYINECEESLFSLGVKRRIISLWD